MYPTRFPHQLPTHLYPLQQSKHILPWITYLLIFYRCTVRFEIYVVHTPTNALLTWLKVLNLR